MMIHIKIILEGCEACSKALRSGEAAGLRIGDAVVQVIACDDHLQRIARSVAYLEGVELVSKHMAIPMPPVLPTEHLIVRPS
jgi:hypothetical protein